VNVLRGGQAFLNGALTPTEIAFDEAGIQAIGRDLDGDPVDCSGRVILPGMIDVHVHVRDFHQAHKEDWHTAAHAALHGGVTTILAMPNTDPPITTLEMIREQQRRAKRSPIHFGLFGGIAFENLAHLSPIAPHVTAFKLYMGETTGTLHIGRRALQKEAFQRVAETGKVLAVHAQQLDSPSEAKDLEVALEFALQTNTKLHLCHVRTQEGIELAHNAQRDGLDVTIETCPHYLFFSERDLETRGAWLKVNPPLATEADREFLWWALQEGWIDILASDHAPHTIEEKSKPFERAPYGLPGVETTLPLMLDAVQKKRIPLARLVEVFSTQPAERFSLARKGRIEVGCDADVVIVDLDRRDRVRRESLTTKCGWSPYEQFELQGWPVMTFVRGKRVYTGERK
jgi:dihydroorotase